MARLKKTRRKSLKRLYDHNRHRHNHYDYSLAHLFFLSSCILSFVLVFPHSVSTHDLHPHEPFKQLTYNSDSYKASDDRSSPHPIVLYNVDGGYGSAKVSSEHEGSRELMLGVGGDSTGAGGTGTGMGVMRRDTSIARKPFVWDLQNDQADNLNIGFGEVQHWRLSALEVFRDLNATSSSTSTNIPVRTTTTATMRNIGGGRRRLYITINTCLQPQFNSSLLTSSKPTLPQLQLYVSNTTANQTPGPHVRNRPQIVVNIIAGFGSRIIDATGDVFIGVYAPNFTNPADQKKFTADWNYEVCLSTKAPYHQYQQKQNLFLIDSDDTAALLITGNMTTSKNPSEKEISQIMSSPPPFTMYAVNNNYSTPFDGLERSYCALSKGPGAGIGVEVSMTRRGLGNLPKQQFHIIGLNKSSEYTGYLAQPNSVDTSGRGGGTIWNGMSIDTKSDGNCQVIYDLPFCSEVAYAVPSNPTLYSATQLAQFYDDFAKLNFENFTYSLQQIPCNTSADSRYSLARNCDHCYSAYKAWLCAVTIPRCADYSSNLPYLVERGSDTNLFNFTSNSSVPTSSKIVARVNTTNYAAQRSRNPNIEKQLHPGPYKEIKPCMDLCYALVQSCPSDFGFSCPSGWQGSQSYGERSPDGDITCSFLGAAYFLSGAEGGRAMMIGRLSWIGFGLWWWWWCWWRWW